MLIALASSSRRFDHNFCVNFGQWCHPGYLEIWFALGEKNGPSENRGPLSVKVFLTSRGEQLMRWTWEEAIACISCRHNAHILRSPQTRFVQCTHAKTDNLPKRPELASTYRAAPSLPTARIDAELIAAMV